MMKLRKQQNEFKNLQALFLISHLEAHLNLNQEASKRASSNFTIISKEIRFLGHI
jgi:hypothetical protein